VAARVSILLPAKDAADTLPLCLRSIARQSFDDFRCIVVDDGSRDTTASIVATLAADDHRFVLRPNAGNGLVAALQTGLLACDGEFVARMDADDWMHRDRLRLQVDALQRQPALAGVGCHARAFPDTAVGPGLRDYIAWLHSVRSEDDVAREAFVECPLLHPTWCLRGEVLRAHGYRDVPWAEDYDLLLRLLQAGHRLGAVPRRLLGWRRGPRTVSRVDPRYAPRAFTRAKAAFLAAGFLADAPRYVLWGHGGTGRALRAELARLGKLPAAIVELHPGRLGQQIAGAPVVPPTALAGLRPLPIVVSIAGAGNRALVRAELAVAYRELRDFVFAA
jgi:glycosyltransferase involved in cell wall biosynthesis